MCKGLHLAMLVELNGCQNDTVTLVYNAVFAFVNNSAVPVVNNAAIAFISDVS